MAESFRSCATCQFFQAGAKQLDGQCRVDPPSMQVLPLPIAVEATNVVDDDGMPGVEVWGVLEDTHYVGWPEVALHDWCGCWQLRA